MVVMRKAHVMETQSPVNHGDSGGPVVNDEGALVAVVSSGMEKQGDNTVHLMSWCIDVREVKEFMKRRLAAGGPQDCGRPDFCAANAFMSAAVMPMRSMHSPPR